MSQTSAREGENILTMTPEALARTVEDFLAGAQDAIVLDDGAAVFDLAQAKYSISGERNKCLLHLWSAERNLVRRVLDVEIRHEVLRLAVQRLGQTRPGKLEICRQRDQRTPTAKRAARVAYQRGLQRTLERRFPLFVASRLTTSADLERSFGPIYARGLLRRGQSGFAVLGVNAHETQSSIDAALTFGILWLDACRLTQAGKMVVEGLKLFLPAGTSALTRERMGHLHQGAAKWQLYELESRDDQLKEIEVSDGGNIRTRLVHWTDEAETAKRFAAAIGRVRELMPEAEMAVISPAEIVFRCHGLEFAKSRLAHSPGSLQSTTEIVFGLGAEETILREHNADFFRRLVNSVGEVRHAEGPRDHALWRLHPERWLESLVVEDVTQVDERLDASGLYSQVPAFSASDRAMIDVLTVTREGRLAVLELKADEDIHLPLQGLDYWSRVAWHHARGEFQRFGYFPGRELSAERPLLFLVAPALHVHPATDTLLHYISPGIEWLVVGIDERWRDGVRAVFRKRPRDMELKRDPRSRDCA
ncbi:MAG: hypothetical protein WBQ68_00135 [Terriglobales bacterium]